MLKFASSGQAKSERPTAKIVEGLKEAFGAIHVRVPKKQITLRLDVEVIEKFRATGDGWQARINEALRRATP